MSGFIPNKVMNTLLPPTNVNTKLWGKVGIPDLMGKGFFVRQAINARVNENRVTPAAAAAAAVPGLSV